MEELTRVRIGTDITMRARLLDSGVAYDFSQTAPVAVRLLSLSQNSIIRDLEYEVDPEDGTILVVTWRASGQCYLGDYSLIVSAELSGRTATFDAPVFTLVRLAGEAKAGQPDGGVSDIGVTLSIESIDTSLVSQILKECREATAAAEEAAAAVVATDEAMRQAEEKREQAEAGRVAAEEKREAAEAERQEAMATAIGAAESALEKADAATEKAQELYDTVLASESERVKAEQAREQAESEREAAEALREQAEAERQTNTAQAIRDAEEAAQKANDAASDLSGTYQTRTDASLNTESKTVAGAINEVNGKTSSLSGKTPYTVNLVPLMAESPTSEQIAEAIGGFDNLMAAGTSGRQIVLHADEPAMTMHADFIVEDGAIGLIFQFGPDTFEIAIVNDGGTLHAETQELTGDYLTQSQADARYAKKEDLDNALNGVEDILKQINNERI